MGDACRDLKHTRVNDDPSEDTSSESESVSSVGTRSDASSDPEAIERNKQAIKHEIGEALNKFG